MICNSKANLDTKNLNQVTPLMLSILKSNYNIAKILVKYKFDPNSTNSEKQGLTCVHAAAALMSNEKNNIFNI